MLTRREMLGATGFGACSFALPGCGGADLYDAAATESRAALAADPDTREILRYATLAANGHNTQPWRFQISENSVSILPDLARRTPVVDPDDHHLFISLGCAAENFAIAAGARGKGVVIAFDPNGDGRIAIDISPAAPVEGELFAAIPERQCTRSEFDGRAIAATDLARLEEASSVGGVDILFLSDKPRIETLLGYCITANTAQVEDSDFVAELKSWIRFNAAQAVETRDGLYASAAGSPTMPAWIGRRLFGFVFTADGENDRLALQMRSSPAVAVFVGAGEDKASWVDVGRSYQRFALQATAMGIRQAFVNQPVEVAAVRPQLAATLGLDRRPDLIVRIGYAPPMPRSLRRPVDLVLV